MYNKISDFSNLLLFNVKNLMVLVPKRNVQTTCTIVKFSGHKNEQKSIILCIITHNAVWAWPIFNFGEICTFLTTTAATYFDRNCIHVSAVKNFMYTHKHVYD